MKVRSAGVLAALVLCLAGITGHANSLLPKQEPPPLVVDFLDSSEMAGVGLVPFENARPLVPDRYTLTEVAGSTLIVVRVAHCRRLLINGAPAGGATVAQVGINILAPEGDGDINNYTLYYDTDNQALATALRKAGADARYVPHLAYAIRGDALLIDVPPPSKARYRVAGPIIPPTAAPGPFTANWWFDAGDRQNTVLKMNSTFPSIRFGAAQMTLTPDKNSPLRALIGGDTLTFPILDSFNTFSSGHMVVEER